MAISRRIDGSCAGWRRHLPGLLAATLIALVPRSLPAQELGRDWYVVYIGPVVGAHGMGTGYGELGFGLVNYIQERGIPVAASGYSASVEIAPGNRTVIGPQISGWLTLLIFNVGGSVIYYTDTREGALRLRPELGIGAAGFRLTWGYNCALTNSRFGGVNRNEISVRYVFRLATLH